MFLLWRGSANKNSYKMVQTFSHNLHYKVAKTLWNLDRHILVIPILYIWIRGNCSCSDEALQKNSYKLFQTISHNLQYKIEKIHFNIDRHILCIPIYWIRGTWWTSFDSDRALQKRTLTNWCRPFPINYCPTVKNLIEEFFSKYMAINVPECATFFGANLGENEIANKSFQLAMDILRFHIWSTKLEKKIPNKTIIFENVNDTFSRILKISTKISIEFNTCSLFRNHRRDEPPWGEDCSCQEGGGGEDGAGERGEAPRHQHRRHLPGRKTQPCRLP